MLLSIIIPVFNVEQYLQECLDSVFTQDISECEIIAINDGSTDGSGSILDEYANIHPYFIIVNQVNKGLSGARNTGIDNAKGEYLYFLDSDDFLLPDAISLILLKIKENKADIIGFNAKINNESLFVSFKSLSEKCQSGIDFFVDFYLKNDFYLFVHAPLYVYKKEFIDKNKLCFIEELYHEDIHFSMKTIYLTKSIIIFDIPIFSYRIQREGSISSTVRLKNLKDKSHINRDLDLFYVSRNFYNPFFYNLLFQSYVFTIMQAVDNNHTFNRKEYFSLKDMHVMKKGIMSEFDFKLWILAIINNKFMINYYRNKLPNYLRRVINVILIKLYNYLMKSGVDKRNLTNLVAFQDKSSK